MSMDDPIYKAQAFEIAEMAENIKALEAENAKLRSVIDDIIEVVEVSDPALVSFIIKRMKIAGIEIE